MKDNEGSWTIVIYSEHNIVFYIVDAYMVFSHEEYAKKSLQKSQAGEKYQVFSMSPQSHRRIWKTKRTKLIL